MKRIKKKKWGLISPMIIIGVLAVLMPVFTFMTLDRMTRQKAHIKDKMMGRGIYLIRTFEAGTRAGMLAMGWGMKRIQTMLVETAVQPEIAYILITDAQGNILAHSDPEQVGKIYDGWADLQETPMKPFQVFNRYRQVDGKPVFEVYKRFVPLKYGFRERHLDGRHAKKLHHHKPNALIHQDYESFRLKNHFIFAGLSMDKVARTEKRMTRQTIVQGIVFFILGGSGIIALFMFQAYRSARASLNRVQAFSDTVVQNMPSGLLTLDDQYMVTSANRAAEKILGAIPDMAYPEMFHLASRISGASGPISGEVVLNPRNKGRLRLDMTVSSIFDDSGKVQGYIFLFRDMTQLQELKKEVETNRRLAAIGKLAGGVAHEIRNPLSSIKGFATYFAKRYQDEPGDAQTAKIMVQEVERINRSIIQLLEFAKPLDVEIRPVEIEPLIRHSLMLVSQDLEKHNISCHIRMKTSREMLATDPDRMNQVLLNLFLNAVNAMEEGGELIVRVRDTTGEKGIEMEVKDTGCGIEPEHLDKIFDPYFTTRPQGTGLGLSIVHRIIETLRGEIRVNSTKGKGTAFMIRLPQQVKIHDEKEENNR
ncbi:MAG: histidine kinase [Desulfobacter postgatei]|uniref:histidine kinase n=1 Tax=Desulfobacter postgatei TaxID=2293 RepID=A0A2G6MTB5_9BACT|nr:MAG: histidine kinase [Desulfobacter postgatei]